MSNLVFIGTSLDGYIADRNGGLQWLESTPNPDKDDLIDEIILTRLPILLGGGNPLFGDLPGHIMFEHIETKVYLEELVASRYRRKR